MTEKELKMIMAAIVRANSLELAAKALLEKEGK